MRGVICYPARLSICFELSPAATKPHLAPELAEAAVSSRGDQKFEAGADRLRDARAASLLRSLEQFGKEFDSNFANG